jgi:hypothetical protein
MTISFLALAFVAFVTFSAGVGIGLLFLESLVNSVVDKRKSKDTEAIMKAVYSLNNALVSGEVKPVSESEKRAALEVVR